MRIDEIMTAPIVTVGLGARLEKVKEIFDRSKFHHLLVVEENKLFGVISDRDLLKALSPNLGTISETPKDRASLNKQAHQIMSPKPVTLPPDASIEDAVDILLTRKFSCIPIVDPAQKPLGIVTWRDMLRVLAAREAR